MLCSLQFHLFFLLSFHIFADSIILFGYRGLKRLLTFSSFNCVSLYDTLFNFRTITKFISRILNKQCFSLYLLFMELFYRLF